MPVRTGMSSFCSWRHFVSSVHSSLPRVNCSTLEVQQQRMLESRYEFWHVEHQKNQMQRIYAQAYQPQKWACPWCAKMQRQKLPNASQHTVFMLCAVRSAASAVLSMWSLDRRRARDSPHNVLLRWSVSEVAWESTLATRQTLCYSSRSAIISAPTPVFDEDLDRWCFEAVWGDEDGKTRSRQLC